MHWLNYGFLVVIPFMPSNVDLHMYMILWISLSWNSARIVSNLFDAEQKYDNQTV